MRQFIALLVGVVLFLSACATEPKVNWPSRVGNFTFDEAVLELGPPDKQAKLGDGTVVAEWLTWRGRVHGTTTYLGRGVVDISNTTSPDYFLRLTFDPSGKLQSFKKYAK